MKVRLRYGLVGSISLQNSNPALRDYFLDHAYDEMFDAEGVVRPHYRACSKPSRICRSRNFAGANNLLTCPS